MPPMSREETNNPTFERSPISREETSSPTSESRMSLEGINSPTFESPISLEEINSHTFEQVTLSTRCLVLLEALPFKTSDSTNKVRL